MFLNQAKYGPVIQVDFYELVDKLFERYHNTGKYRRCIIQPKGHYCILKTTPFSSKHCLASIL